MIKGKMKTRIELVRAINREFGSKNYRDKEHRFSDIHERRRNTGDFGMIEIGNGDVDKLSKSKIGIPIIKVGAKSIYNIGAVKDTLALMKKLGAEKIVVKMENDKPILIESLVWYKDRKGRHQIPFRYWLAPNLDDELEKKIEELRQGKDDIYLKKKLFYGDLEDGETK